MCTLAYSSMRNEEWGIWKQGISHKENRWEKWENARPKSSILEDFGGGNDRRFKRIFNLNMVFEKQNLAYLFR